MSIAKRDVEEVSVDAAMPFAVAPCSPSFLAGYTSFATSLDQHQYGGANPRFVGSNPTPACAYNPFYPHANFAMFMRIFFATCRKSQTVNIRHHPPRTARDLPRIGQVHSGGCQMKFDRAWATRDQAALDDLPVNFICRKRLLHNKLATGRPKYIADAQELAPQE